MKLVVFIALSATAAALSAPTPSALSLRPSISAFRPEKCSSLGLKGGGNSEFPIDAPTALKMSAAIYALYGAFCMPDLNLPLLDLSMKMHETRHSLFYNDPSGAETESNIKDFRWIGLSFFAISGFEYLVATEADAKTQKTVCKFAAMHSVASLALMFINKQPIACGGHIVALLSAVVFGANGL